MSGWRDTLPDKSESRETEHDPCAAHRPPALQDTLLATDPREGRPFGFYRILRRLGLGGMGHVYLALDTRLGRHVALKFLPPQLLANPAMLTALEQEARTASALNHPNILTIYEVGEHGGELFIASEFIDGVNLKKAIQKKSIDGKTAVLVASQVASALTAAHSAGVIHRDLKPANIMIRPDGYVKVIDFGLAKVTSEELARRVRPMESNREYPVVGTIDYMSPEQARGEEVDERSDIWSLGVVLFEMLSGQLPFTGESDSHVIVAILDRPAPTLPNLSAMPRGCGRILTRALAKSPRARYASAAEMQAELDKLISGSSRLRPFTFLGQAPVEGKPFWAKNTALLTALLFAVAITAAASFWWIALGGSGKVLSSGWFQVDSVRQVTFNGHTRLAAISPDGKYLAFVTGESGGFQTLHVKQSESPADEVKIAPRAIDYIGLTFSPDGRMIYATEKNRESLVGSLYAIPLIGPRASRPVVVDIDGAPAFSPDGDRFVFLRFEPPTDPARTLARSIVEIANTAEPQPTALYASDAITVLDHFAWSPDGKAIAGIVDDPAKPRQMALFDARGGPPRLTPWPDWSSVGQLCWDRDGRTLLFTATSKDNSKNHSQIRQYVFARAVERDVTKDLSGYASISLAADGSELAAVKSELRPAIWVSERNDFRKGRSSMAEALDGSTLAWTADGQLVTSSSRTGYPNLAFVRPSDQSHTTLTNEPFREQNAVPLPHTQSFVFSSNRSGEFHLWRYDADQNRYTQLTSGLTYDDSPAATPDGQWVVYTAWKANIPHLFKVRSHGGTPVPIGDAAADAAQISPDGKFIACRIQDRPDHWSVVVFPFEGVHNLRKVEGVQTPFRWAPDGKALTHVITTANGIANLWNTTIEQQEQRQLTFFEDEPAIVTFAWSEAGDELACLRVLHSSDVVLLKRQRTGD